MRWDEFGKLLECGFDEVTFEMVPIERRVEVILMKTCHQPDLKTEMRRHLLGAGSGNPSGLHSKPALPRVRWRKIIAFYLIVWTVLVATSAFSAIASAIERTAAEPPKGNQATHFIDRQTKRALPEPPGTVLFEARRRLGSLLAPSLPPRGSQNRLGRVPWGGAPASGRPPGGPEALRGPPRRLGPRKWAQKDPKRDPKWVPQIAGK